MFSGILDSFLFKLKNEGLGDLRELRKQESYPKMRGTKCVGYQDKLSIQLKMSNS